MNNNIFDEITETMMETGKDLRSEYKETSLAGLAKVKLDKLLKK